MLEQFETTMGEAAHSAIGRKRSTSLARANQGWMLLLGVTLKLLDRPPALR